MDEEEEKVAVETPSGPQHVVVFLFRDAMHWPDPRYDDVVSSEKKARALVKERRHRYWHMYIPFTNELVDAVRREQAPEGHAKQMLKVIPKSIWDKYVFRVERMKKEMKKQRAVPANLFDLLKE